MSTTPLHRETSNAVLPGYYMTLREAAERLGLSGRAGEQKLRRLLHARERVLGHPIMIRRGGKVPRTLVTMPLLEEHCPELFSRRIQLTEELREEVGRLEAQIALVRRQNLRLAEELSKVASQRRANR